MSRETVLIIWFLARLTVLVASTLSVMVLWEKRRESVVGYLLLFWVGLAGTSFVTAGLLLLALAGVLENDLQWTRWSFVVSQVVQAPLAVTYALALIGRMPPGPVRWLFGEAGNDG